MSRARLLRRLAVGVAALLVVLLVVGIALVVITVRRPFPTTDGELTLPGLSANVSVVRDAQGTPQIYADTPADLFAAQGFAAAQDRFFEMDLRRHITAGRLSELVGDAGVETDKVIRTMGWRRVAEQELPLLSSSSRAYLQAYADGVNAYLNQAGSPDDVGLEYSVLALQLPDYTIEPWTPLDSLTWLKAMAWDLRGNYDEELTRARLAATISLPRIAQLFPAYPADVHKTILSRQDWVYGQTDARDQAASRLPSYLTSKAATSAYAGTSASIDAIPALLGQGSDIGSNSWVVAGSRTSTGKPLLANDPHLALSQPGIWYQTGLHCRTVSRACPFDVSGFSFAGLPGIITGHNATIAWGITNLVPDVTDFYLEQVVGDDRYIRDGQVEDLTIRTETIKVRGGDDVPVTVRSTVHGPILSDVIQDVAEAGRSAPVEGTQESGGYAMSMAWTALTPGTTMDAVFLIDTAGSFDDFRAAAATFDVPAQNLVYADTAGHIGYQAPGMVPIRQSSTSGAPPGYWPAPGWKSAYDWKGFVPFKDLPWTYDPKDGFLVAANQEVTESTQPFLTTDWDFGWRSQRIRDLVAAEPKMTPARMAEIQLDTRNSFAPTLVTQLLAIDLSDDSFTKEAQGLLRGWDYTQPAGSSRSAAAAAYFNSVWAHVLDLVFDDEMPAGLEADGGGRYMQAVTELLKHPRDAWWDDKQTANITEDMTATLRQALVDARLELTMELGKNPGIWQWGRLHQATMTHAVLGGDTVPWPVQQMVNRGPIQLPGGSSIVNALGWDASQGYEADWGPSMRMVVDLSDFDASRYVNQTGNSGHPYAAHYVDQLDAWATGQTYPWPFTKEAVDQAAEAELTLVPAPSG